DGIRDRNVTGVQTCALPIWNGLLPHGGGAASPGARLPREGPGRAGSAPGKGVGPAQGRGPATARPGGARPRLSVRRFPPALQGRSEERRVGKSVVLRGGREL